MADTAPAPISFKKRANKSSNIRKRPATPPPEDHSDSESDSSTDDASGTRIKRRKKEGLTTTTSSSITRPADLSKSTLYTASRSTQLSANDDATRTQEWSVSDAAAKVTSQPIPATNDTTDVPDGAYKGSSTYGSFISKTPNAPTRAVGPVKAAPGNVRTITVTDFAPDVCKDYKQTGFCGFGDNCKFLHAREDYKQGWQLDKEWESAGKKKGKDDKSGKEEMGEDEKMLEGIPFLCIICKGEYKTPVVTKCGHYFCEKCAMGRFVREKKRGCANCGVDTNGTFAMAKRLTGLLERKKRRIEEKEMAEAEDADDAE